MSFDLNFKSIKSTAILVILTIALSLTSGSASSAENANPSSFNYYDVSQDSSINLPARAILFIEVTSDMRMTDNQILTGQIKHWKQLKADTQFKPNDEYWFKLGLSFVNEQSKTGSAWLISPGLWHNSWLYYRQAENTNLQAWQKFNTSVFVALPKRSYPADRPSVLINGQNQHIDVYIKAKGFRFGRAKSAQGITLQREADYLKHRADNIYVQGAFLGFALGLAGFHFILWVWFREKTYIWLVAALLVVPAFYHSVLEFSLSQFWPNMPVWNEYAPSILAAGVSAIYLMFGASYLNLFTLIPSTRKVVYSLFFAILLSSLAVLYKHANLLDIQGLLIIFSSILLLSCSSYLAYKGYRYAWYFVVGNSFVLVSMILWPLADLLVWDQSTLPFSLVNFAQFASATQGILLALGMVERMQSMKQVVLKQQLNLEKQHKRQAQQTKALIEAQNVELASSNRALKELDDLKDDFLARTSHELNTPLNGVIGLSEILLDKEMVVSEVEKVEYLELIKSRGEHLKELVTELLEFVKTRKEIITLYREEIDLTSHVQKLCLTFKSQAEAKGLKLIFKQQQPLYVFADARRVKQALSIILDNAIKYTDKGEVKVTLSEQGQWGEVNVIDTGIGISEQDILQIYEPFKQVKHKNTVREGAGLGLSIGKHLIELHGGRLTLNSTLNKGSQFTIQLPKR